MTYMKLVESKLFVVLALAAGNRDRPHIEL